MDVEKGDAFALAKLAALHVEQPAANLTQSAHRDMTGNQRIRNTLQPALLKVNVSAADLRKFDVQHGRVFLESRLGNFTNLDGGTGFGNHSDARH